MNGNETNTAELKWLGYKYGISAAVLVLNSEIVAYLLGTIIYTAAAFLPNAAELTTKATDAGYIVYMIYNEIASYLVPILVMGFLFAQDRKLERGVPVFEETGGYKRFFGDSILLYFAGWFVASSLTTLKTVISEQLNRFFGIPETQNAFARSEPLDLTMYITFMVCICFIAPVCEELLYRGILLRPLRKYSDSAAAMITSLLFALAHMNFDQIPYTFALGYFLAVMAIRSDTVIVPMIFHVFNNLMAAFTTHMPDTFGSAEADAFFGAFRETVEFVQNISYFISIPVALAVVILKMLRLKNNSGIPLKKQFAEILFNPVFLISVVLILGITVTRLYS